MAEEQDLEIAEDERDEQDLDEALATPGSSGTVAFIGGLLLGAVIGAGIALLVAPERGVVVRRRLRHKLHELQDEARDQLDDWRDEAGTRLKRQRRRLERRLQRR